MMDHLDFLEGKTFVLEQEMYRRSRSYEQAISLWITIPGIRRLLATTLVAEIGERKPGRTRKGNAWLRRALCEAAWAASHTKNTYLAAQFRRLAARRGVKRATLAVAHTILIIAYHMLKKRCEYRELGGAYFDQIRGDGLKRYYLKRLQQLGVNVAITPATTA